MMSHVVTYLIASSIIRKHTGHFDHALLDRPLVSHPSHTYLLDALQSPGVYVHWGVYGSGKTVSAYETSRALQAKGRTVVFTNGYNFYMQHGNLKKWLRNSIGIPSSFDAYPISSFFSTQRATIIIDDVAPLMTIDGIYELLQELATDSVQSGRFNVLLCVTSFEWAVDILKLEGCFPKLVGFPGCARWNESQLKEFASDNPYEVDALIKSGVPPFTSRIRAQNEALTLDLEWKKGIQALSQLFPDSFTIPMTYHDEFDDSLGPGTYPDKTGRFTV